METIRIVIFACWCLIGGYLLFDNSWFYLSGWAVVTAGGLYFLTQKPTEEGAVRSAAARNTERPTPPPSPSPAKVQTVEAAAPPREKWEDWWGIEKIKIPIVGTSIIQRILPYEVGMYVPHDLSPQALSGEIRIIVGGRKGRRIRLGPGGYLLKVACGLKTLQGTQEMKMPVLPPDILQMLTSTQDIPVPTEGVFEKETAAALRMVAEQLGTLPRLSPEVIAQATAGQVWLMSTVGIIINGSDTPKNREDLLQLFQRLLLPSGQDPMEAIGERVRIAQSAVRSEGAFTADCILSTRGTEYSTKVREHLRALLKPFALIVESYGVLDIRFQDDVQDFRDTFGKEMRRLATRMTTTLAEMDAKRAGALRQSEIEAILAEGRSSALREYLETVGQYGIVDPILLYQLLLADALKYLQTGGVFVQLGGGGQPQPTTIADPVSLQILARLVQSERGIQEQKEENK